jgi:hypothetical protein
LPSFSIDISGFKNPFVNIFWMLLLMGANGLAKLRGRFKRISLSNRAEASRLNLLIFLNKPIYLACWCLLIALNFRTACHRP